MHTTVQASSKQAYEAWKKAQAEVEMAARIHAEKHTAETKRALEAAQANERKALSEYSKSRLVKYAAVLGVRS